MSFVLVYLLFLLFSCTLQYIMQNMLMIMFKMIWFVALPLELQWYVRAATDACKSQFFVLFLVCCHFFSWFSSY